MTVAKELLEDIQEFGGLIEKVESILKGEKLDNVVPVLTTLLGEAGWMSRMPKQEFVKYVSEALDATYDAMYAAHGRKRAEKDH